MQQQSLCFLCIVHWLYADDLGLLPYLVVVLLIVSHHLELELLILYALHELLQFLLPHLCELRRRH